MRAEAKYSRLRLRPGAADERACGMRRCYVFAAEAELAEHFGIMLALKGRRTERVEAFGREFPGAAGKAEAAAAAVGDFLPRAPIIGPLALPQPAPAADLAHRDLRPLDLRVDRPPVHRKSAREGKSVPVRV